MSFRANYRRHSTPDDEGYILPTVIVVLTVGAMVAIALLGYAAALLKAGGDDADSVLHLYAADAGITTMKHRLEQGTATPPEPFMFGDDITVKVKVITPIPQLRAPLSATPTPQPVEPHLPDPLDDEYPVTVIIKSVPPGLTLDVRWQYRLLRIAPPEHPTAIAPPPDNGPQLPPSPTPTPTPVLPSIKGYVRMGPQIEGTPTPTPIVTSTPCPGGERNCVMINGPLDLPGVETIEFIFDLDEDEVSSLSSFESVCPARRNISYFCLSAAPLDYVVVSTTDRATVTAYIRQIPRWRLDDYDDYSDEVVTYKRHDVVEILSWKPSKPSYSNLTATPTPKSRR